MPTRNCNLDQQGARALAIAMQETKTSAWSSALARKIVAIHGGNLSASTVSQWNEQSKAARSSSTNKSELMRKFVSPRTIADAFEWAPRTLDGLIIYYETTLKKTLTPSEKAAQICALAHSHFGEPLLEQRYVEVRKRRKDRRRAQTFYFADDARRFASASRRAHQSGQRDVGKVKARHEQSGHTEQQQKVSVH